MPTEEYERIIKLFSMRLKKLLVDNNLNQVDLSVAMGLSRSTVNKWVTQKAIPRMVIIEKLASYFGVPKSYFLEEGKTNKSAYYVDQETAALAQGLKDNTQFRVLLERIKKLCKHHKINIPKLEESLGFGSGTISKWGKSAPGSDKIIRIAVFFHVTTDYLLGVSNVMCDADPEITHLVQILRDNPQSRTLLESTLDLSPETVNKIIEFIYYQRYLEESKKK